MDPEKELPETGFADIVKRPRKPRSLITKSSRVPESQPEREIFARNFRRARTELGLTQKQVYARTGVATPHVSEIENALHNVCIDTMVKLAQLVKKPVYELLKP